MYIKDIKDIKKVYGKSAYLKIAVELEYFLKS